GAADWSFWRGPYQTGVSPDTGLPDKFDIKQPGKDNLIWTAPYSCRSTPIVQDGHVYFLNDVIDGDKRITEQERLLCLDANTGKMLWEYRFNIWHTDIVSVRVGWTNPVADPKTGYVYCHGTQGLLLCLDKNGKLIWSRSLTEEFGRVSGYGG